MPYVSTLLGQPVTDVDGEAIGTVDDLLASLGGELPHPPIVALQLKVLGGASRIIPADQVVALVAPAVVLNGRLADLRTYEPAPHDTFLARDVLDKQIIDTNGMRVVRVNDLDLARVNGLYFLANVDTGGIAIVRRLGLSRVARWIQRRSGETRSPALISWSDVELLPGDDQMRLRVPSDKMSELHPADLAEIISDLDRDDRERLLESLDVKTVADALEEVEPDFQASLVESMTDDRVADVLEEMAPDEAADLLAELSQERSEDILNLMEVEEAQDVRKLLAYPDDTAGGIMNTEFIAVGSGLTANQALGYLRQEAHNAETLYYIYVTEDDLLRGVFSLRELVMANPDALVASIMHKRVVTVRLQDSQDQVAQAVSKYNLLAVPVVDDEGRLQGLVTADDALDKVIPTGWKKRLPRFYH